MPYYTEQTLQANTPNKTPRAHMTRRQRHIHGLPARSETRLMLNYIKRLESTDRLKMLEYLDHIAQYLDRATLHRLRNLAGLTRS